MMQWWRKIFNIDEKGRPAIHNSRKQILIAGLLCLAIWPGVWFILLIAGQVQPEESWWIVVSPWVVLMILGIHFIGQAVLSSQDWPKFEKIARAERQKKRK